MVRLILHISKGLLRESSTRRWIMFYLVLAAMLLLFIGTVFLDSWLRKHPLLFLGYWALCAWMTLFSVLLALFDMLMVRANFRRQRLKEQESLEQELRKGRDFQ